MGLIPPLPCPESFPHCYLLSFNEGCEIHSFGLEEKCGDFHDEGGDRCWDDAYAANINSLHLWFCNLVEFFMIWHNVLKWFIIFSCICPQLSWNSYCSYVLSIHTSVAGKHVKAGHGFRSFTYAYMHIKANMSYDVKYRLDDNTTETFTCW